MLKTTVLALGVLAALASTRETTVEPGAAGFDAEDALARTHAAYAKLDSYADSGTLVDENDNFQDTYTFRTLHTRQPRNFMFDFRYEGSVYNSGAKLPGGTRRQVDAIRAPRAAREAFRCSSPPSFTTMRTSRA